MKKQPEIVVLQSPNSPMDKPSQMLNCSPQEVQEGLSLNPLESLRHQPMRLLALVGTLCGEEQPDEAEKQCFLRAVEKWPVGASLKDLLELHEHECLLESITQHGMHLVADMLPETITRMMMEQRMLPDPKNTDN